MNMVLDRAGLIHLLKEALWNKSSYHFEIYEGVYDIMHNGTENGISADELGFEKVADDILYTFGAELDEAEPMTLEEIEAELGRKIRIV